MEDEFDVTTSSAVRTANGHEAVTAGPLSAEALWAVAAQVRRQAMAGHSGFALVASLRADPQHSTTPVIGLTVKPDPQQIALARKLHISEIVSKIDRRGLLSALAELNGTLEEAA